MKNSFKNLFLVLVALSIPVMGQASSRLSKVGRSLVPVGRQVMTGGKSRTFVASSDLELLKDQRIQNMAHKIAEHNRFVDALVASGSSLDSLFPKEKAFVHTIVNDTLEDMKNNDRKEVELYKRISMPGLRFKSPEMLKFSSARTLHAFQDAHQALPQEQAVDAVLNIIEYTMKDEYGQMPSEDRSRAKQAMLYPKNDNDQREIEGAIITSGLTLVKSLKSEMNMRDVEDGLRAFAKKA